MRSGVIAQKVGMTRVYTEAGEQVPVTVLRVDNCQVVAQRTAEKNGYTAVQLGVGTRKVKNTPQGAPRPFRQGRGRAEAQGGGVPRQPREPDRCRRRDHRRPLHRRPVRRRDRHVDRQGLCRRHEAPQFQPACAPRTASRSRTARTVRPVSARTPARCSRARRWPATWATCASPRRTCRSCAPMSSAA